MWLHWLPTIPATSPGSFVIFVGRCEAPEFGVGFCLVPSCLILYRNHFGFSTTILTQGAVNIPGLAEVKLKKTKGTKSTNMYDTCDPSPWSATRYSQPPHGMVPAWYGTHVLFPYNVLSCIDKSKVCGAAGV